jgi:predicted nucleic acid-binding protein
LRRGHSEFLKAAVGGDGLAQGKPRPPDAFAAALALELRAPLLTGDPDFKLLERDGALSIEWIA